MQPVIELKNVSKSYDKKILNNLSIKIEENEIVAIVGESGKGKSTLLNIIGLLEDADSGEVIIDNEKSIKINSSKATKIIREKISYLFQNFALIEQETVFENLEIALKYVKLKKADKIDLIKSALKSVDLEGYEKRKIYELSGGEQQRVAMARVVLKPSKIVLADEPTGSLDCNNRNKIMSLLKQLNKKGKTIVIVTHDREVANSCDRIIEL
ncbi:ABC transporter ATP-binding protein [Inconstantimicrobium mannanitabidum]|uniref:Bacteriocin ABC transporter ATP-binding protein n=1 Tax=Inconstantimicrobium mannanitabidum TaxID=1604901 RepID=A0ACB5RIR8_9CLOT|nr:ABC transporter ATP-binding protein [Clostridium sp. TW13]GKX68988.1 bacteriocin ABC transporter ATP-binding protein [Clostridium sp. TW13]